MRILDVFKLLCRDIYFNVIASSVVIPPKIRVFLYNLGGMDIKTSNISPRITIGGTDITIDKNTFISYNCFFDNNAPISIGKNCSISMEVLLITSFHSVNKKK